MTVGGPESRESTGVQMITDQTEKCPDKGKPLIRAAEP